MSRSYIQRASHASGMAMNLYDELAALHKELQDALRQKDEQQAAWETKCDFIQKKLLLKEDRRQVEVV